MRAVYPRLLLITHEEIPGLLPARTTGFRLADSANHGRARAGDPIRFWLQGTGYDNNDAGEDRGMVNAGDERRTEQGSARPRAENPNRSQNQSWFSI